MKKITEKELKNIISEEVNNLLDEMFINEGAQANRERVVRTAIIKYFKEYQNKDLSRDEAQKIFYGLKHDIPNIHGPLETKPGSDVKIETFFYGVGVARLYAAGELNNAQAIKNMNNILGELCENSEFAGKYDENLNDNSMSELMAVFGPVLQKKHEEQMAKSGNQQYSGTTQYRVVRIPNFTTAKQYAKYMDSSAGWCVTHSINSYNQYTAGGVGLFYFLLKEGFENIPKEQTENYPLDEYGLSMIAVGVGANGAIETLTSRWNHEVPQGFNSEMIMDPSILSQDVLHFDIYSVCKPRTDEELEAKGIVTPNSALRKIENGDSIREVFDLAFGSERENVYYVCIGQSWYLYDYEKNQYLSDGKKELKELNPTHVVIDFNDEKRMSVSWNSCFIGCNTVRSVVWDYNGNKNNFFDFLTSCGKGITSITFTEKVERIPSSVCCYFSEITSVTIPNSVKEIGVCAFQNCSKLSKVNLPFGLKKIESMAFNKCISLQEIIIPDTVESIDNSAFYHCNNLTSVKLPNNENLSLSSNAFEDTPWFTKQKEQGVIYLGRTLLAITKEIKGGVFNVNEGTKIIGDNAFSYHNELEEINLPKKSLVEIRNTAFDSCASLKTLIIPNTVTYIGTGAFKSCHNLKTIHLPENLPVIFSYTFINCSSLENIKIPETVNMIRTYAFRGCTSLREITIPKSVEIIDDNAFEGCTSLSSITFEGTPKDISCETITHCTNLKIVRVPSRNFPMNRLRNAYDFGDFEVIYTDENDTEGLNEVTEKQINLSSFNIKKELNPKVWKDGHLDSRIRMKLLDVADDFIESLDIDWAKPVDIIMTGSLANYNWSDKFSDIDLHILYDFSSVDKNTELIKDYFNAQKKIWNQEHGFIFIYGFTVEIYVEDSKTSKNIQSGVYSLEKDKWIDEPSYEKMVSYKPNKSNIKKKIAEYINIIEDIFDLLNIATEENDIHKYEDVYMLLNKLIENISRMRKRGLQNTQNEMCDENIIFKALRRGGYIDKIFNAKNCMYDKINSLS